MARLTSISSCSLTLAWSKAFLLAPTVHKDVSERLRLLSPSLYEQCRVVLERNKSQRHIRGGMATKIKYAAQKKR
ncbi:MAG: sporulation transcriptional regulator SpoIIID [Oscillospiraceae bacterium]